MPLDQTPFGCLIGTTRTDRDYLNRLRERLQGHGRRHPVPGQVSRRSWPDFYRGTLTASSCCYEDEPSILLTTHSLVRDEQYYHVDGSVPSKYYMPPKSMITGNKEDDKMDPWQEDNEEEEDDDEDDQLFFLRIHNEDKLQSLACFWQDVEGIDDDALSCLFDHMVRIMNRLEYQRKKEEIQLKRKRHDWREYSLYTKKRGNNNNDDDSDDDENDNKNPG